MNFKSLAEKYGTPLYVYDFELLKKRFEDMEKAFASIDHMIAFAVKSNSNINIIKEFSKLGAGADCVSGWEIKKAIIAGIPTDRIIFSGVGKTDEEIEFAIKNNILMINVESYEEILRISKISKRFKLAIGISVRVNPDVDPKTHPHISTGLKNNKFGVDVDTAKTIYLFAKNDDNLNPIGIHFHIGSQITDLKPIIQSAKLVSNLVQELRGMGLRIEFFDVGGGIGIRYTDENTIDIKDYANGIIPIISKQDLKLIVEPGRFLIANFGYLLTKVLYEKHNGTKRFLVVDAGMNDFIRPALYGAKHKIELLTNETREESKADIVGPICESSDFFAKDIIFPKTYPGDLLLIHDVGAYGFSMSSNYNSRLRPAEVAVEKGKDRLIRIRESFEDMIKNEVQLPE